MQPLFGTQPGARALTRSIAAIPWRSPTAAATRWLAVAFLLIGIGLLLGSTSARAQVPESRLLPIWNLVAAPSSGPVPSVLGDAGPALVSVHRWEPQRERFSSWFRDAPPIVNTLTTLREGEGLWVAVDRPADLALPTLESVPDNTESGWRLVGWTQATADADAALESLGARRLLGWDAADQSFRMRDSALPARLNTLTRVARGDALWAFFAPNGVRLVPALGERRFDQPIEMGPYPGEWVFLAEQDGLVRIFDLDGAGGTTLLDLRDVISRGPEEGLLSVALAPDFETTGRLYAYFTVEDGTISRLARFRALADRAALSSELRILDVVQPFGNHNGGAIRFGSDGFLYLSLGDGGSGGDPFENGQNLSTLLGSIIRIDVSQATAAEPYRIPADNPFAATPGARAEIFAFGLRNPWRMSFDPASGRLWAGDVGQDRIEEIDIIEAGGNYGWNRLEGNECFDSDECSRAGIIAPVATYTHAGGNCSVTGGVVYRGDRVPAIADSYLYADFCSGQLWAVDADRPDAASLILNTDLTIASFGQDASGEVYLLTFEGQIVRIAQ